MSVPTAGQKRILIVGATGMIGGYALCYALNHPAVASATVIGRGRLGISHPKLKEVLHRDVADCSALAEPLSGQDAVVFRPGTYTGSVPDAELRKITVDYTIEFARVLRGSSPDAVFSLEREWRRPDRTKSHGLRTLQRRSREVPTRSRVPLHLPLPTRVHLPSEAAIGAEFQLPPLTCDLPRVSDAVPQPGDSGRRLGPGNGGCRRPGRRGAGRAGFREPRHTSNCRRFIPRVILRTVEN
jgi:hypothetical protein